MAKVEQKQILQLIGTHHGNIICTALPLTNKKDLRSHKCDINFDVIRCKLCYSIRDFFREKATLPFETLVFHLLVSANILRRSPTCICSPFELI